MADREKNAYLISASIIDAVKNSDGTVKMLYAATYVNGVAKAETTTLVPQGGSWCMQEPLMDTVATVAYFKNIALSVSWSQVEKSNLPPTVRPGYYVLRIGYAAHNKGNRTLAQGALNLSRAGEQPLAPLEGFEGEGRFGLSAGEQRSGTIAFQIPTKTDPKSYALVYGNTELKKEISRAVITP